MSTSLRDKIVSDIQSVQDEWSSEYRDTKNEVTGLNSYYCNVHHDRSAVIERADQDSGRIHQHYSRHQQLSTKANNSARNLETQVTSSEDGERRMKTHGLKALVGLALLVVAIAIGLGVKQFTGVLNGIVIAVVTVVILIAAVILYLILRRRAMNKASMWRKARNENEEGLGVAKVIEKKRRLIKEICDNLKDIQQDNFDNAVQAVIDANNEYLA